MKWDINDLTGRERFVSIAMVVVIVWLGLFPNPVFKLAKPSMIKTLEMHKLMEVRENDDIQRVSQVNTVNLIQTQK